MPVKPGQYLCILTSAALNLDFASQLIRVNSTVFKISIAFLFACVVAACAADNDREDIKGPAYSHFHLTLEDGWRTEAVAPFFYTQQVENEHLWAIPPFTTSGKIRRSERSETDILYPFLTIRWYGKNYRWQFFQLFSFAGGPTQEEVQKKRFTLFPIYFQQRSADTNLNYTALFPDLRSPGEPVVPRRHPVCDVSAVFRDEEKRHRRAQLCVSTGSTCATAITCMAGSFGRCMGTLSKA